MSRLKPKPLKNYPWYLRLFFWQQKKQFGEPLLPVLLWGRHPKLLLLFLRMGRFFKRKDSKLCPILKTRVMLKVSEVNRCAFCIDLNASFLEGFKQEPTAAELAAIDFAEAIIDSNCEVTDKLFDSLRSHFDEDAIVELTGLIGYQDLSSKFNAALGIEAHGFCKIKPSNLQ